MKYKGKNAELEGSHEELLSFLGNTGFDASAIFDPEKVKPFSCWRVVIPAVLLIIVSICNFLLGVESFWYIPLAIIQIAISAWCISTTHLKYKSTGVTWISVVSAFLIFAISVKAMTLIQAVEYMERIHVEKSIPKSN